MSISVPSGYYPHDETTLAPYLSKIDHVASCLGGAGKDWQIEEVGDSRRGDEGIDDGSHHLRSAPRRSDLGMSKMCRQWAGWKAADIIGSSLYGGPFSG